ncbi:MAG: DUF1365 domain-containing protein [Planctomycetales bacterium]|nr:DUF1365 domain-containing protein [Planctomycetales bacterium]
MQSCIYEGYITHQRYGPIKHRFAYRIYLGYLDLAELPQIVGSDRLISDRRFAATSFDATDMGWGQGDDLLGQVRRFLSNSAHIEFDGPVRLLSPFRHFGYYFSPLNLYFCYQVDGRTLQTIVVEVNNTPWGERHWYVLDDVEFATAQTIMQSEHAKQFHVSPFMPMGLQYRWRVSAPNESLSVGIDCLDGAKRLFSARMSLRRRPLDRPCLRRLSWRYPLASGRTTAAIYFQALQLWLRRCPFYPHPRNARTQNTRPTETALH